MCICTCLSGDEDSERYWMQWSSGYNPSECRDNNMNGWMVISEGTICSDIDYANNTYNYTGWIPAEGFTRPQIRYSITTVNGLFTAGSMSSNESNEIADAMIVSINSNDSIGITGSTTESPISTTSDSPTSAPTLTPSIDLSHGTTMASAELPTESSYLKSTTIETTTIPTTLTQTTTTTTTTVEAIATIVTSNSTNLNGTGESMTHPTDHERNTGEPDNAAEQSEDIGEFELVGQYFVIAMIVAAVIVVLAVKLWSMWYRGSDEANYSSIWLFFQTIGDVISDVLFAVILYLQNEIMLFSAAAACTSLAYIISCIIGIYWMERWRNRQEMTGRLNKYLSQYDSIFVVLIVICDFYAAIELLRSKLFHFDVFNLPLKKKEYFVLKNIKFINIVVLENIPQFIIQIIYVVTTDKNKITPIVFLSMAFSVLSILLLVMSEISRLCQLCRPKQTKYSDKILIGSCLTIKSPLLRQHHAFSNKKIESCILDVFEHSKNVRISNLFTRSDISVDIECFYINQSIRSLQMMKAYFEITILAYDSNVEELFRQYLNQLGDAKNANNILLRQALTSVLHIRGKKLTVSISDVNTNLSSNSNTQMIMIHSSAISPRASNGVDVGAGMENLTNNNINNATPGATIGTPKMESHDHDEYAEGIENVHGNGQDIVDEQGLRDDNNYAMTNEDQLLGELAGQLSDSQEGDVTTPQ